jgi:hypothetical protein
MSGHPPPWAGNAGEVQALALARALNDAIAALNPSAHTADLRGDCAECSYPIAWCRWQPILAAMRALSQTSGTEGRTP